MDKLKNHSIVASVLVMLAFGGTLLISRRVAAQSLVQGPSIVIRNGDLEIILNVAAGIAVTSIRDLVTGHEYLPQPSPLFELAVSNSKPTRSTEMTVLTFQQLNAGQAHISARTGSLDADLTLTASPVDPAVVATLSLRNTGSDHLPVRAVFPKLQGLIAAGDWSQNTGMIPQEIGIVAPLHLAPAAAGLAPVMRSSGSCGAAPNAQQDMFLVGNDGAFWTQFECNDGIWTSPVRLPRGSLAPPGAQVAALRRNGNQEDVFVIADDGAVWTTYEVANGAFLPPARLWNDTPITAPAGGGIAAVVRNDHQEDVFFVGGDGAIWTSFEAHDGHFSQPIRLTPVGLAPPGASITALMRNPKQEDVFVVDNNGAIQTVFEVNDSPFYGPIALSAPKLAVPGNCLAAVVRNEVQEDLFVIGSNGFVWTMFERNSAAWAAPIPLALSGLEASRGGIAAVRRNDHQEDVFWVDGGGRIATMFETYDNPWSQPVKIGPASLARPGAPLAAMIRNDHQEDVFVVGAAGEVVTFYELNDGAFVGPVPLPFPDPIGKKFNINVGLPNSMNTMEVASVYDPAGGGGLFFADVSGNLDQGVAPLQFTLSAGETVGFWIVDVPAGAIAQLPSLAIGVTHTGDWRPAVDYYARTNPAAREPAVRKPAWLDNAGAIYTHTGLGAGSIYLELGGITLSSRITSFLQLSDVLNDANQLNANTVYLLDYWEGAKRPCDTTPYLNKGDYVPRSDLSGLLGEVALSRGISDIHSRAGHIIMYLEPFIISTCSKLAMLSLGGSSLDLGQVWAARDPLDMLYGPPSWAGGYNDNFSMVAPFKSWQNYIASVAERLVGQYGADGVFLDSWSWQMNWPVHDLVEGRNYSPLEDSMGVLALADRVRQGIQRLNPEAVVMGETTSGPIGKHWDGGLGAEFAGKFNPVEYIAGRILASPARYGAPDVHYFSNGHDLNELNQVFAAGQGLALCCNSPFDKPDFFIRANAPYIANLVKWRQDYADALIHGRQRYQPKTDHAAVAAYSYLGAQNRILTVVNTSVASYKSDIQLDPDDARFAWLDFTTGKTLLSNAAGRLPLQIAPGGLEVLQASAN